MMLSRIFVLIVFITITAGLHAEPLQLDGLLPKGSQYAVYVHSIGKNGEPLYEHNSELLLPPASTQKVVTALVAKLVLGDKFSFVTTLERAGEDLVFRFSGDPTLTRQHLRQLLTQYKNRPGKVGIRHIWLDGSAFSGYERGQGWPWDGAGSCYSAPSAAITLDGNCINTTIHSNAKPGNTTKITPPKGQPITVTTSARIVTRDEWKSLHCDLGLIYSRENEYRLTGCMVHSKNPLGLKLAVQNPALFTQAIVKRQFKELGIKYSGEVKIGGGFEGKPKKIARHRSATLPVLLDVMLKRSNNLIADTLFKTIAREHYGQPGTYIGGERAVKAVLEEKAGIDLSAAILADGSGLSRNNRMSVRQLAEVIRYIGEHDKELKLLTTFPVSGKSGTLKSRSSVNGKQLKGRLKAKTGSVYGTKNLAGILKTAKGKQLVVTQIVTNYFHAKRGKGSPLRKFERKLFGTLYRSY